jgi:acyl-CoA reductase-like NAD-dependent aldehyde dehydrogenase
MRHPETALVAPHTWSGVGCWLVGLADRSEFGLTACICTRNLSNAMEFAGRVRAGVVKINGLTVRLELQVPFGGIRKSSSESFKEQGEEEIDFHTRIKPVYMG